MDVDRAARRIAGDDAYRSRWIIFRPRQSRHGRQRGSTCSQMQKLPSVGKFHFQSLRGMQSDGTGTTRLIPFLKLRKWQCRLLDFSDVTHEASDFRLNVAQTTAFDRADSSQIEIPHCGEAKTGRCLAVVCWPQALRFRTNQVRPKDWPSSPVRRSTAVD